jgi:uncharacterized protein YyaL (SSP411 family)
MPNRLADAISPYLKAHASNPVDWFAWGDEAFAEAVRRDVPVLVSIGYSTCHWCHVMARESFSDPQLAAELNSRFVAVKVDREEHPEVDASYLAAASAFTRNLGWPLTVFVTPQGRVFYAGTYFPPEPRDGIPSFRQVLDAVSEAWTQRRGEVDQTAAQVAEIVAASAPQTLSALPSLDVLDEAVATIREREDSQFGGFGMAPKFPLAPALAFLMAVPSGRPVALRTLRLMAESPLRDTVEGGFFRYAVRRDWSEPHYERMLYDNAQLLRLYADAAAGGEARAVPVAEGLASFLLSVMLLPSGGFASAQDSESTVAGERQEGAYYRLGAADRASEIPPDRDAKVLTGWNGLAIGALAHAGFVLDRSDWVSGAAGAADHVLATNRDGSGLLARASLGARVSDARATLEDYGMLADGLIDLALATGDANYAIVARELVTATVAEGAGAPVEPDAGSRPFIAPGGSDPVLTERGLAIELDPSEGAYPSGWTAIARAAHRVASLQHDSRLDAAARAAMSAVVESALAAPISFGAALELMVRLAAEPTQLIVVTPDGGAGGGAGVGAGVGAGEALVDAARGWSGTRTAATVAVVSESQAAVFAASGFDLFDARATLGGRTAAYLCTNFVCALPTTEAADLGALSR